MTTFELNGTPVTIRGNHPHLLSALREELDVISPKDGCSPTGQCGCCTVLIDGKARVACQVSLDKTAGSTVTTLEGMDPAEVDRMARAFAACGALQCGFCTPGIAVRTKALIDRKGSALTREEASRHLGGHLCRCTGYIKVLDAVEALASGSIPEPERPGGVGSSGVKYEGLELAVGLRPFIDDMRPEGLLHGAFKLADHARADVVAIDVSRAEAVEGVERVFTAADVPGALRVGLIHKDWPIFIPVGGRTSYLGDVLAMVVARDRETARAAAGLVDVTYDVLPPIVEPAAAVASAEDAVWGLDGNVLSRSVYSRGDAEAALAGAAHVVHETFQTQRIDHAFVEPESTLAVPEDDGALMVYSGGQGIWDDRNDIAAILDVDPARITVELVSNGGAFGGKEDMSNQGQTALAAWLLKRPVKVTFSREESLLVHTKRHPIRMEYRAGCDAERPPCGAACADARRLRALRLGRNEGPRTRRRSRQWSLCRAQHRRRSGGGSHQQLDRWSVPGLRGQPGPVRHGGGDGPTRRRSRDQRLGDAPAQCGRARQDMGPRADHGRRLPRRPGLPRRYQACFRCRGRRRQAGRPGSGPQELRLGQRVQGGSQSGGAFPSRWRRGGPALLDRDGSGCSHSCVAGGGGGARHRP